LSALDWRWKELKERCRRLPSWIAATPARTVDGMHARIAFASSFNVHEREDLVEGKVTTSSYPPLWITRIITARRALMNAAP
jgi:hypothetical protein